MAVCPGSYLAMDAPGEPKTLVCPHCGQAVAVQAKSVFKYRGEPRWALRGHQEPSRP